LVFHGPGLLARIKRDLVAYAERHRLTRVTDAAGSQAQAWAAKPLDGDDFPLSPLAGRGSG